MEILPTGTIRPTRAYGLVFLELMLYLGTCQTISHLWTDEWGSPVVFSWTVAMTLFCANMLCGVYTRRVYVVHFYRLIRSGLSHILAMIALWVYCRTFIDTSNAIYLAAGMSAMTYVVTNTLRPVLVEVVRAGTNEEQRRQPASTIS